MNQRSFLKFIQNFNPFNSLIILHSLLVNQIHFDLNNKYHFFFKFFTDCNPLKPLSQIEVDGLTFLNWKF